MSKYKIGQLVKILTETDHEEIEVGHIGRVGGIVSDDSVSVHFGMEQDPFIIKDSNIRKFGL